MNAKRFFIIPALMIAGAAFADVPQQYVDHSQFAGNSTRAEVKEEAARVNFDAVRMYANGQNATDMFGSPTVNIKTRAEVKDEAIAARSNADRMYANGQYAADLFPAPAAPIDSTSRFAGPVRTESDNRLAGEHLIGG
ncbi:hypothetical protein E4K72_21255 [Oxalobacteraceae bacterium OM1]|nr:hypothetical protein E4K72_21255 [Oxalobacteraceae bacterium OM1]